MVPPTKARRRFVGALCRVDASGERQSARKLRTMKMPARRIERSGKTFIVASMKRVTEKLFCAGKGDVSAEADHAESGGSTLACAEGGARFEFAFEWSG